MARDRICRARAEPLAFDLGSEVPALLARASLAWAGLARSALRPAPVPAPTLVGGAPASALVGSNEAPATFSG
jgi:hypothetical protein